MGMAAAVPSSEADVAAQAGSAVAKLLQDCDAFLFDCDGTLYHAGTLLPHVAEALELLRKAGKKLFFVTNTSSRSRDQLCSKLRGMGVPCEPHECVPSCVFLADYVKRIHPSAERVYVIGGQGVVDELAKVGIAAAGGPSEDDERFDDASFVSLADDIGRERCDGVVLGWDTGLTYRKIVKSSLYFQRHPDAFFYATNDDGADRVGDWLLPGNGPLLKGLEAACAACAPSRLGKPKPFGAEAAVLGKPNPDYARLIAEWNGIDLSRAVMVGDRLDTDILMAQRAGMRSLFVLTGVDDLVAMSEKGIFPDFVLPSVGSLWSERSSGASRL
uniref:Predicted HAD superfamily sugar phosphatase n=1 Tax=Pfiesteria piscicida TaxID=71001 RepID=A3E3J2_PFIPI|nr:predicted HAD superfamily sugar phosphatase [Pfiesteria piscicida]